MRPDLRREQAWHVLQAVQRHYDAAVGINWDVLRCHADFLCGHSQTSNDE